MLGNTQERVVCYRSSLLRCPSALHSDCLRLDQGLLTIAGTAAAVCANGECRICTGCTDDSSMGWRSARILRGLTPPVFVQRTAYIILIVLQWLHSTWTLTGAPGDPEGVAEN